MGGFWVQIKIDADDPAFDAHSISLFNQKIKQRAGKEGKKNIDYFVSDATHDVFL